MTTGPSRRRLLQAGLAGSAAAALGLSGCSRSGGADAPLQFWQFYAPASQSDPNLVAQSDWFTDAIDRWQQAGNRPIQPVFIPAYTDPTNTRLATAFASESGPDLFLISPGDFVRYYNGGVLADLTPYLDAEVLDDYYPEALATRTVDGKVFGLPMEQEPLAIFYDVAAFEDAGLSEGDLPTTWEEMLELGRRLTSAERAGLVFDTTPSYYQNFTFYPWVWQGGGEVVDPDTQQGAFDSDAVLAALQLFSDSVSTGAAPRTLPAAGDVVGAFQNGFAAMWQTGVWQVEAFAQNAPDLDYGVFTLPTPSGGDSVTSLGGWSFVVNAQGRDPDAAARFTAELLGSMSTESIEAGVQWNGVAKGNMPARRSVTEAIGNSGAYENPTLQFFRDEVLPTGRAEPRYPPPILKAVSNAIQSVQLAGGDPQEQAEIAQEAIDSYLVTYEGADLR